jgi:serine/threonine protein kinase
MTACSYRRVRYLGHGGMSVVYAAERVGRDGSAAPVACKYMRADLRMHPRLVALFFQEAALGFALSRNHPGLVEILDCYQDADENMCLVMELVDGCTLRDLLTTHGPLPPAVVRAIARHLLGALAHLHAHAVVHRDLSPCNVLMSLAGEVKLSDLGLARVLDSDAISSGGFRGKVAYASPEQLTGGPVDARSDLFSLGVMLYRMLTGQLPFGSEISLEAMLARILGAAPALAPDVPADLRALTLGLLAARPEARAPASANAALAMLDAAAEEVADAGALAALVAAARSRRAVEPAEGEPGAVEKSSSGALTQSWAGQARPRRRRWPWLLAGMAVLLALLCGYQAYLLLALREDASTRATAPAEQPVDGVRSRLEASPEQATREVEPQRDRASEEGSDAASARQPAVRPRTRHTARRAPAHYFTPDN